MFPVEVFEIVIDVLGFARRLVVCHKRMFPHINTDNIFAAIQVTEMLFVHPGNNQVVGVLVVVQDCPADSTSFGSGFKLFFPSTIRSPLLDNFLVECAAGVDLARTSFKAAKVIFVVFHAVEFKRETALIFCSSIVVKFTGTEGGKDFVCVFDISRIKAEVFFGGLFGNTNKVRNGEGDWFVHTEK